MRSAQPPVVVCPYGGIALDTGIDTNGNGVLDAAEVTGTQYVCNGAPGTTGTTGAAGVSTLVAISNEPAGANCASGGARVQAGPDANGNGVLDAGEVTSNGYVCNGAGNSGANGLNTLASTVAEPAGVHCAYGGQKISSGLDANGNGVLDAGEVAGTSYVCNGAPGSSGPAGAAGVSTLAAISNEPAGANCANGGQKVTSGLDTNGNGALDAGEVTSTTYVCNGSNGTNGTNGVNTLLTVVTEPAGANCTYGGQKIGSGVDLNANQALDPGEVAATTYVCNGAPGTGISWVDVTGTSQQAAANTGYLADSASPVEITLPDTASLKIGDLVQVSGRGAGGWYIAQNQGQSIVTDLPAAQAGVTWTARGNYPNNLWMAVASSADGSKLVAAVYNGQLYTSTDFGVTWTARDSNRAWYAVASSADGSKLVASANGGQLYTSTDFGVTWTARDSNRDWYGVASSADGSKLVAAVTAGQLYTSTDFGVTWTARDSNRAWYAVASSADGSKLVAAVYNGQLYTSTDFGLTWTARDSNRAWYAVASSADGSKLVASANGGQLYTSSDFGVTWTARDSNMNWAGVASSADGSKLVAAVNNGQLYTSTDFGLTWTAHGPNKNWVAVASSADGGKLVAADFNGQPYTSTTGTTVGSTGYLSGNQYDTVTLRYIGGGTFLVTDVMGNLVVH